MKKLLLSAILCALTLSTHAAEEAKPNSISINGTPISQHMLRLLMVQRLQPGQAPSEDEKQKLINEMVDLILLSQEATAKKLDQEKEHAAALEFTRISYLANAALKAKLKETKVDEQAMKDLYKEKFSAPSKEFKASHILVKTEKEATDIIEQLKKGGNFAELAKKHSLDTSAKEGGDLGWFPLERMVKPFADAVGALKKGAYTDKPVQTEFGFHIVKLDDSKDVAARSYEEMKGDLEALLRQRAMQNYIIELRKKADVKSVNLPQ